MKDNLGMNNIIRRLRSESPSFFQKLSKFCAGMAILGTALYTASNQFPNVFPETSIYVRAIPHLISIGTFGTFLSFLTVKDNSIVDKNNNS